MHWICLLRVVGAEYLLEVLRLFESTLLKNLLSLFAISLHLVSFVRPSQEINNVPKRHFLCLDPIIGSTPKDLIDPEAKC